MTENKPVFLVIFETKIAGTQTARTEVSTTSNPLNSRQVRRDCEKIARLSFEQLAKSVGVPFLASDPIKCVECVEFKPPADDENNFPGN
jgi:hypothetical protein